MAEVKYYSDIEKYMTNKVYPNDYTANQKAAMRKRVRSYELRCDGLYYKIKGLFLKIILSETDRWEAIKKAHVINDECHLDRSKTYNRLCSEFRVYWKDMATDVNEYMTNRCEKCCNVEDLISKNNHEEAKNWKKVVVTILGPFPESNYENRFICVLIYPESNWVEALPMKDHNSDELAKCIESVFMINGWSMCYFINLEPGFVRRLDRTLVKLGITFENRLRKISGKELKRPATSVSPERRSHVIGILSNEDECSLRSVTSVLGETFACLLRNYTVKLLDHVHLHNSNWENELQDALRLMKTENCDSCDFTLSNSYCSFNTSQKADDSADLIIESSSHGEKIPTNFETENFNILQRTPLKTYSRTKKIVQSNNDLQALNSTQVECIPSENLIPVMPENKRQLLEDKMENQAVKKKLKSSSFALKYPKINDTSFTTQNETDLRCPHCFKVNNWSLLEKIVCSHSDGHICVSQLSRFEEKRKCNYCEKTYTKRQGMKMEKLCNSKTINQKNFLDRNQYESEFKCIECKKVFATSSALSAHTEVHNANLLVSKCDKCGVQLCNLDDLRQHIHNLHEISGRNPSDACLDIGKNKSNMWNNLNRFHDKPHKCDKCEYSCKSESTLKNHQDLFHNEINSKFTCTVCPYRAEDSRDLRDHYQSRHKSNPLQINCQFCSIKFKNKNSLRQHLSTHTDYLFACPLCSYTAKFKRLLYIHVKIEHPDFLPSDVLKESTTESVSFVTQNETKLTQDSCIINKETESNMEITDIEEIRSDNNEPNGNHDSHLLVLAINTPEETVIEEFNVVNV